jgi:hypothetical protein
MPERPQLLGLLLFTDDLAAALLTWRSLRYRVLRLRSDGAVLEGQGSRIFIQIEPDHHRARELYPVYYTESLPAVLDAFESQGGRVLETRLVETEPVHLLLLPTGHRIGLTDSALKDPV